MSDISMSRRAQNKRALYLLIAFLIGAVAFSLLYIFMTVYRGLIGLAAMIFFIGTIFIYTKHVALEYIYSIRNFDTSPMLTVVHKVGKRETTMCGIYISGIVSIEKLTREELRSVKPDKEFAKYNYCPTMGPDFAYLITYRTRSEGAKLLIEATDEFAAELQRAAKEYAVATENDEF
jgi:hypothetical protein